ncbi:hypothetical protein BpHYR1_020514, partial [Brachionus plicatilis]
LWQKLNEHFVDLNIESDIVLIMSYTQDFLQAPFITRSINKKQYIKRYLVHNRSIKYKNADITMLNIKIQIPQAICLSNYLINLGT